ncbi:MAG: flagellar basal-body MS-ring/collar protein FliF [Cellvibrionaceae bacterium]
MAEAAQDLSGSTALSPSAKGNATNDLVEGFNGLNLLRQVGLMVGLAISVAVGFAAVMWSQEKEYRPMYGSLDRLDSAEVVQIFEANDITYKVDGASGALLVAADDVNKARLRLAEAGISDDKSVGFELLDKEQPLGSSQFMENARYRRGLEGELARTITSIRSVRSARVHLAIPKASVFVRDNREPRASVFIELYPGRTLSPQQVQAVANIVASSISELKLENVTIVDQKGQLFELEIESPEFMMAGKQREYTRKLEKDYTKRVNSILEPIVGVQNYRAEVSAEVDFTSVEQAAETFNPDLPAIRSEQTVEEARSSGAETAGIPGALTNQPPGNAQAPEVAGANGDGTAAASPTNSRSQATRNYELDRTVSYTKHQVGQLKRLTVAVVLNDRVTVDPESGAETRITWTESELERLGILVRDAVGFSAARGDSVNIINSSFLKEDVIDIPFESTPIWQEDWFLSILKIAGTVFIIIALLFGLLRPILKSLAAGGLQNKALDEAREAAALESSGMDGSGASNDETVTLSGGNALSLPSPDKGYEQHLSMVKGMIAEDPGRVAQVVKRWAAAEE